MTRQPTMPFLITSARRFFVSAGFAACVVAAPGVARADRVELTDGRVLTGVITFRDTDSISIQTGAGEIRIRSRLIQSIKEGSDADHLLLEAKYELSGKKEPGVTIKHLAEAAAQGVDPASLAELMIRHRKEVADIIPQLASLGRDRLTQVLDYVATAQVPGQGELIHARLVWQVEARDFAAARRLLGALERDHPRTLAMNHDELVANFEAKYEVALDAARPDDAMFLVEALRRLDPDRAGDRQATWLLVAAGQARGEEDYDQALSIYAGQLMDLNPVIARERIANALQESEQIYRERGELGRSIELYTRYGMKHAPELARPRLGGLFHELGSSFLNKGDLESARNVFSRADDLTPGSATRDLALCDYIEFNELVLAEDHAAQFKLGEWCLDNQMYDHARKAFEQAAISVQLRPYAIERIAMIEDALTEIELDELMSLYDEARFVAVIDGVDALRARPLSDHLLIQAERLRRLARAALRIAKVEPSQQAEVLWQRAEAEYFTGDRDEAFVLLRMIMERFPGTPAAERSYEFYKKVRPTFALDRIESRRARTASSSDKDMPETIPDIIEEIRKIRDRDMRR